MKPKNDDDSSEEDNEDTRIPGIYLGNLTLNLNPAQWSNDKSRVTFAVTLVGQGTAKGNWFKCKNQGGEERYRIPPNLECNGVTNCPLGGDEDKCGSRCDPDKDEDKSWYEVQYLLTILLAGLFFILSPICIVIFLFYHRRMSAAAAARVARHARGYPPQAQEHYVTDSPANVRY